MSSRHQPEHGADSERFDPADATCDYCGKTVYVGHLHQQKSGRSIAWLCEACVARDRERYERMVGAA